MNKRLLTVCVITYNHSTYIRECLDTILMQQLDCAWQIVIADDCSTDGTQDILKEYQQKYPELIHLILQKKNVGPEKNWADLLAYPQTKYLLYTEGDDYFTDKLKLQKQLDFLKSHPDHALCFHPVRVAFQDKGHKDYTYPGGTNEADFTLAELLNQNYIQTNSVMYRWHKNVQMPKGMMPGDWYLHLLHAKEGKIGFIPDVMTVYRRHEGGSWWGAVDKKVAFWKKNAAAHMELYRQVYKLFGDGTYDASITASLSRIMSVFIELYDKEPSIFDGILVQYPDLVIRYMRYQESIVKNHDAAIASEEKRIAELSQAVIDHREHITAIEAELARYHGSLSHKLRSKAGDLKRSISHK